MIAPARSKAVFCLGKSGRFSKPDGVNLSTEQVLIMQADFSSVAVPLGGFELHGFIHIVFAYSPIRVETMPCSLSSEWAG
jgi:hypothetical protein